MFRNLVRLLFVMLLLVVLLGIIPIPAAWGDGPVGPPPLCPWACKVKAQNHGH